MSRLSDKDAMNIALEGSRQFHAKNASAVSTAQYRPDPVLKSHQYLAQGMYNTAQELAYSEPHNVLANYLAKAASYVAQGYPAKTACYSVTRDRHAAEKLAYASDQIANDILAEIIVQRIVQ
jgi:hypothetical protein